MAVVANVEEGFKGRSAGLDPFLFVALKEILSPESISDDIDHGEKITVLFLIIFFILAGVITLVAAWGVENG